MSLSRKLLFTLVVLALFLGGAELALTAMQWPSMEEGTRFEHERILWKQDADQSEARVAHPETRSTFRVSTDSMGLRAPLHEVQKESDRFRVMTMGCSTTFGWGVEDGESYPAQLERILRERGHEQLEVINAGQPGYTSFQGRWLWDEVLREYEPDLVVLGFIVQDARKVAYSDLSQALLQQEMGFLKSNLLYKWRLYLALRTLTGKVQIERKDNSALVYRVGESQYLENLRHLRQEIQDSGGQVMHFGFPLERVGYTEQHRLLLKLEAEAAGLPHYDPSASIEQESKKRALYFPQDRGHANAAGCEFIAEGMADYLENQSLLPETP